jgi:uncharacterized protein YdhG (YjbR/CyaY superfamily)
VKGEIMEENKTTYKSIDEYILQFSPEVQELLKTLRKVIKEAAPEAEEKISCQNVSKELFALVNILHYLLELSTTRYD